MPMDPWVSSGSLRFQTGFSLILLILAGFIASIELLRHGHGAESWMMAFLLAMVIGLSSRVIGRLRTASPNKSVIYINGSSHISGVK